MPDWNEVLTEIIQLQNTSPNINPLGRIRNKYLSQISAITGRNTIAYYSGWLQKPNAIDTAINDKDKMGLMLAIHKLNKNIGLDLLFHTPGGDIAATESFVDYLFSILEKNLPQNV